MHFLRLEKMFYNHTCDLFVYTYRCCILTHCTTDFTIFADHETLNILKIHENKALNGLLKAAPIVRNDFSLYCTECVTLLPVAFLFHAVGEEGGKGNKIV